MRSSLLSRYSASSWHVRFPCASMCSLLRYILEYCMTVLHAEPSISDRNCRACRALMTAGLPRYWRWPAVRSNDTDNNVAINRPVHDRPRVEIVAVDKRLSEIVFEIGYATCAESYGPRSPMSSIVLRSWVRLISVRELHSGFEPQWCVNRTLSSLFQLPVTFEKLLWNVRCRPFFNRRSV